MASRKRAHIPLGISPGRSEACGAKEKLFLILKIN
jgi:hypothetical protein